MNNILIYQGNNTSRLLNAVKNISFHLQRFAMNGKDVGNNSSDNAVYGSDGDDTIANYYNGTNVTINAGAGNDEIYNSSNKVIINGGIGDDFVVNNSDGTNVTINGGEDNDSILNRAASVQVYGQEGNDSILNEGGGG